MVWDLLQKRLQNVEPEAASKKSKKEFATKGTTNGVTGANKTVTVEVRRQKETERKRKEEVRSGCAH